MSDAGSRDPVVRFLDELRAAESAGAEVFSAWVAVCAFEGLRGGLRTIAAREATHADLLGTRLRELGASCRAAVAEPVRHAALACFGSPNVPDLEKLGQVLSRYPGDADVARPILGVLPDLTDDPETHELLRLVAASESASMAWLRAYHAAFSRSAGASPRAGVRPASGS